MCYQDLRGVYIMTIHFNVQGKERKRLAEVVGSLLGKDVKYTGVPTFAYRIDRFTVDRDGSLSAEGVSKEAVGRLLERLHNEGFERLSAAPSIDSIGGIDSMTLSFSDAGFDEAAFERLKSLCNAKANLITNALDTVSTEVVWNKEEKAIQFPWFRPALSVREDEKRACILFLSKLIEFAKSAKRVTAREKETYNAKYAFRCFLLRLGFIGDEYKAARKILLSRLTGNAAFKSKEDKESE